jgi:hypothetical protein
MLLTGCASLGLLERGQHGAERAVALLAFHRCRSEPRDRSGRDSPFTRAPTVLTLGLLAVAHGAPIEAHSKMVRLQVTGRAMRR